MSGNGQEARAKDVLATLKQLLSLEHVPPIVVLADQAEDPLSIEALKMGAQDVLTKAHLTGELLSRAARYAVERALLGREGPWTALRAARPTSRGRRAAEG